MIGVELAAALTIASLLYALVEKPFLRLRDVKLFSAN